MPLLPRKVTYLQGVGTLGGHYPAYYSMSLANRSILCLVAPNEAKAIRYLFPFLLFLFQKASWNGPTHPQTISV